MTEPSITSELNPKKLGRLLKLYSETEEKTDSLSPDQQRALLLRNFLADALPLSSKALQELPVLMQQMYGETPRLEGKSLYELLLEPKTALHDLEAAKELAKRKVNNAQSQAEKEVAGVVYYTAIAAALAFHGEKITQHSDQQLRDSFESLASKKWILVELKDLFKTARNNSGGRSSCEQGHS